MTNEDATGAVAPPTRPGRDGVGAGWWPSPWSAAQVAAGKVSRGGLQSDRGRIYWAESRPDEGGRQVVVEVDPRQEGAARRRDVSPPGVSVRSRVHEYGGGAATVAGGVLYFVDQDDQDWYRVDVGSGDLPVRLTSTGGVGIRHADGRTTPDGRWLVTVQEQVSGPSAGHRVVAVPTDGSGEPVVLVDRGDFVAAPRPSPDGRWLAWCTWDHPDMPWDATVLQVAPLVPGDATIALGPPRHVAGGPGISVGQPRWTSDGALVFVDDRSGWWVPYRVAPAAWHGSAGGTGATVVPSRRLVEVEAEFHGPDWVLGLHTYDEMADGSLVARMGAGGRDRLVLLRPPTAGPDAGGWSVDEVDQPCVSLVGVVSPDGVSAVVHGATPTEAHAVFAVALDGSRPARRLSAPPGVAVAPDRASVPVPRSAAVATHAVPGLFFPPTNPDVTPDPAAPPPLVVFCHGGPTSAAEPGYDPVVQFLTSRGIAVAAVNYRGSTGYGRAYRDLLRGTWGEGDVDDCVGFARALAADGLVDGCRMAIRGTSAGGLTALAALVRSRVFAGAVAWYGVTDLGRTGRRHPRLRVRATSTAWWAPCPSPPPPTGTRSPIHRAADLAGRVLLLQGADDPIVPLDQAERFAAELPCGQGCRLRAGGLRGRVPRLPASRHHRSGPRGRTRLLPDAVRPGRRPPWLTGRPPTDGGPPVRGRTWWPGCGPCRPTGGTPSSTGCPRCSPASPPWPSSIPLYREWGRLAVGPYVVGTLDAVVARRRRRASGRRPTGRATARAGGPPVWPPSPSCCSGPRWCPWPSRWSGPPTATPRSTSSPRSWWWSGPASGPPTATIPYQVVDRNGHILIRQSAIPVYELYYPYLPGMVVFGFSSGSKVEARLTDARIQFLVFTVIVALVALSRMRPSTDARTRSFQALTALPTAALPAGHGRGRHAGGGADAARTRGPAAQAPGARRPGPRRGQHARNSPPGPWSSWPCSRSTDRQRRRAVGPLRARPWPSWSSRWCSPSPSTTRRPSSTTSCGSRSAWPAWPRPRPARCPATSWCPLFPAIHRPYVIVAAVVGLAFLARYLVRRPPRDAAAVARVTGWVMLVAILLAPATRVGYLLYPINLFLWAWMFRCSDDPAVAEGGADRDGSDAGQLPSGVSNTSIEYGVDPVGVVGETTTPTSQ